MYVYMTMCIIINRKCFHYCCSKHLTSCTVSWIAQNWINPKHHIHPGRSLKKRKRGISLAHRGAKARKNTELLIPAGIQITKVLQVPRKVAKIKKGNWSFLFVFLLISVLVNRADVFIIWLHIEVICNVLWNLLLHLKEYTLLLFLVIRSFCSTV